MVIIKRLSLWLWFEMTIISLFNEKICVCQGDIRVLSLNSVGLESILVDNLTRYLNCAI